jgi:hypothetical protein
MKPEFSAHILRERFTIEDMDGISAPIIALSNRFFLSLTSEKGKTIETFVIRGQMLHTVVRMAGMMMHSFSRNGPLLTRETPFDFDDTWEKAAGMFEYQYNENLWIAVYHNGKQIYSKGQHHTFLDVIEQCEALSTEHKYEDNLRVAEELFNKVGKPVSIHYEANIASNIHVGPVMGRSALILRGAQKTSTFIFTAEKKDTSLKQANPVHFIAATSNYFEGIQLAFQIGQCNEKIRHEMIDPKSDEMIKHSVARDRLAEVADNIRNFEKMYDVYYRPEKPSFAALISNAEEMMQERLNKDVTL